jgi:hypothetical protein
MRANGVRSLVWCWLCLAAANKAAAAERAEALRAVFVETTGSLRRAQCPKHRDANR